MLWGSALVLNATLFVGWPKRQEGGNDAGDGKGFAEDTPMEVEQGLVPNVRFVRI